MQIFLTFVVVCLIFHDAYDSFVVATNKTQWDLQAQHT